MAKKPAKRRIRKPARATRVASKAKRVARAIRTTAKTKTTKPGRSPRTFTKPRAPVARSRSQATPPTRGVPRRPSPVAAPAAPRKATPGKRLPAKPARKATPRASAKPAESPRARARRLQAAQDEARRLHRNELARRRYRDAKGVADALEAARIERLERARQRRQAKKQPGPPDERSLAIGWLHRIRESIARTYPISLTVTEAGGGGAELERKSPGAYQAARATPWLAVGRFDFVGGDGMGVSYEDVAEALQILADDALLEAMIHPQRLSQIRIVWSDPKSVRHEGDCVLSKIGAWEWILSDLIGEIIGSGRNGGDEDADATSLAGRYAETTVTTFYVFFSTTVTRYVTAAPWAKTQTISIQKARP